MSAPYKMTKSMDQWTVRDRHGEWVCEGNERGKLERLVNLANAAGELLDALKALVGEADLGEVDLNDEDRAKLDAARVAVAKAEGSVS